MLRSFLSILVILVALVAVPGTLQADDGGIDDGGVTTTSCELESCTDHGPISDPNGLTHRAEPSTPFGALLDWLRLVLPV